MIREPFKTTEIQIGKEGNRIYHHPDGDMMFRDDFVPGIRLKDLSGLSDTVILDPAIIVEVSDSDWISTIEDNQQVFYVTINHDLDINPSMYIVNISNNDGEIITIDSIKKRQISCILKSTVNLNMVVQIKRIY